MVCLAGIWFQWSDTGTGAVDLRGFPVFLDASKLDFFLMISKIQIRTRMVHVVCIVSRCGSYWEIALISQFWFYCGG